MAVSELILRLIQQSQGNALSTTAKDVGELDDKAGKAAGSTGTLGAKLGGVGAIASGFVVGAALTSLPGLLMDGAKGAAEDEAALGRLNQAIDNTGSSSESYSGQIEDLISNSQELAFTDGETADALSMLVSLTGSTEEGMARLADAQDLARGAGISLDSAAKLLGKTSDENTAALGRLGIKLGEGATATDVLAAVQEKFGGQAQQYASSAAGEYQKFNNTLGELQESVGSALIPVFMALAPVILQVVQAALPLVEALAPLLALAASALAPVLTLVAGALAQITSHTPGIIALGLALAVAFFPLTGTALLIAGVAAAIAAVVAVIYTYRDEILGAIQGVLDWVTDNWPLIVTILGGPVGAAVALIITHWDEIMATFQGAWDFVSGLLTDSWSTIETLASIPVETARDLVQSALQGIQDFFQAAWDFVSGLLTASWSTVESLLMLPVEAGKAWIDLHVLAITTIFNTLWSVVSGLLTGSWSLVQSYLADPVNSAKDTISTALTTVIQFFTDLPTNIVTALGDLTGTLTPKGTDLIQGLITGLSDMWGAANGASQWLAQIPTKAADAIVGAATALYGVGQALIQGAIDGILSMAQSIADAVASVIPDPGGGIPFVPGIAGGGRIAAGGLALVGERGPELVTLPTGAVVHSNSQSAAMVKGAGRGGQQVINLVVDGKVLASVVNDENGIQQTQQGLYRSL